ncbi:MAG TPA: hypothetical protein VK196_05240 [Magnetospirillum sp.]|nr:hypothetical protein [Magnetospirillum sp.]
MDYLALSKLIENGTATERDFASYSAHAAAMGRAMEVKRATDHAAAEAAAAEAEARASLRGRSRIAAALSAR